MVYGVPSPYRLEPGLDYYYRRKQMGRPLNKKFFGTPTPAGNEIKVQFHNGTGSVAGWIIKQVGAKRFKVTDGSEIKVCSLVDKASAAIAAGEMTITINDGGTARQVTKIAAKKVTLDTGTTINWDFTGTGDVVEMEEAGDDATIDAIGTDEDDFEGDDV